MCLAFHRDTDTLVGLPRPIHESVKTLKQVSKVGSSRIGSYQGKLDHQGLGTVWGSSTKHIVLHFLKDVLAKEAKICSLFS